MILIVAQTKKKCSSCGKLKPLTNFYKSDSEAYKIDGKYPVCKLCIQHKIDISDGVDPLEDKIVDRVKNILMDMNKPFILSEYKSAINEIRTGKLKRNISTALFGLYYKNISLNYKQTTWKDSIFDQKIKDAKHENMIIGENKNFYPPSYKDFQITKEIEDKWGIGYTSEEYYQFERKYNKLILNYPAKTALHVENLKTYIRFRVKEQMATAQGNVKEAKEWGTLASKAATDAKLNASQLSKSDLSGGVDVLSQLFEAVENEDGLIPLLPKVIEQPYDDVDLIIWANVNYNRRLEGKEPIDYKSVWVFYDDMLTEYTKMQGMTENQITNYKTKRNNVFRDLSKVYKEPLYDEGDL